MQVGLALLNLMPAYFEESVVLHYAGQFLFYHDIATACENQLFKLCRTGYSQPLLLYYIIISDNNKK